MPNWCSTSIKITASEKSIGILAVEMEKALSNNPLKADFGNKWLGNLLLRIGMPKDKIICGAIRCRGSIEDMRRLSDTELVLETETAWSPMVECVDRFVKHYVDDARITYTAVEPMLDMFVTNDVAVVGTVYIDCWDIPEDLAKFLMGLNGREEAFVTREVGRYLHFEESALRKLERRMNEKLDDEGRGGGVIMRSFSLTEDEI